MLKTYDPLILATVFGVVEMLFILFGLIYIGLTTGGDDENL
jgi:hypothetical protein